MIKLSYNPRTARTLQ